MVASNLRRWFSSSGSSPRPAAELDFAFASDPGCHRPVNEDCAACLQPPNHAKGLLAVVADGMGGHAAGAEASSMAVRIVGEKYFEGPGDPQAALTRAFHAANRAIHKRSSDPGRQGMGSTSTALAIVGANAFCAHVGDSRLYLIRDGEIHQLTDDHSKTMELVRQGVITPEQARQHAQRNVIFRALGRDTDLAVSTWNEPLPLRNEDRFILSSDGLHDLISDPEIRDTVLRSSPRHACDDLVKRAREAGGFDNITVIVGHVIRGFSGESTEAGFGVKRG